MLLFQIFFITLIAAFTWSEPTSASMGINSYANQKIITIGGIQWPITSNLKILVGHVVNATGAYSAMREPGSSSNYVVPVGKTFKGIAFIAADAGNNSHTAAIGYADTAPTYGGASAPTNPVFMDGGGSTARAQVYAAASTKAEIPLLGFSISAGKYPFCYRGVGGETSFYMIGYEE